MAIVPVCLKTTTIGVGLSVMNNTDNEHLTSSLPTKDIYLTMDLLYNYVSYTFPSYVFLY